MPEVVNTSQNSLKRRLPQDDTDCEIIEVKAVKRMKSDNKPSYESSLSSFFTRVSKWFNNTRGKQYNPSRFFSTYSEESNSAADAIAGGGQYLSEASNDKFMPDLKTYSCSNGNINSVNPQPSYQKPTNSERLMAKDTCMNGNGGTFKATGKPPRPRTSPIPPLHNQKRKENTTVTATSMSRKTCAPVLYSNTLSDVAREHNPHNGPTPREHNSHHVTTASNTNNPSNSSSYINMSSTLHQTYTRSSLLQKSRDLNKSSIYYKTFHQVDHPYDYHTASKTRNKLNIQQHFDLEEKERYNRLLQSFMKSNKTSDSKPESSAPNSTTSLLDDSALMRSSRLKGSGRSLTDVVSKVTPQLFNIEQSDVKPKHKSTVTAKAKRKELHSLTLNSVNSLEIKPPSDILLRCNKVLESINEIQQRTADRFQEQKKLQRREEQLETYEIVRKQEDEYLQKLVEQRLRLTPNVILPDLPVEPKADEFPELSEEANMMVDKAWGSGPDNVLSEAFRIKMKRSDLRTLTRVTWLNDEVINFYLSLVMDRGEQNNDLPTVYITNTFFYHKIKTAGHAGVKRWTKKIDIFSKDLVLIPCHLGMHWTLAAIDFREKTISYYDSMGGANNECLSLLCEYLKAESLDKKKQQYDMSGWSLRNVQDCPQQMNGGDCGVFTCKFAEYLSRDAEFTFSQENMPYFRRRMVYEILTKKLM